MTATPTAGPAPGLFPILRRKRRPSISYRNLPAPAKADGGQVGKEGEPPDTATERLDNESLEPLSVKGVMTPRERMLRVNENNRRQKLAAQQLAACAATNG